MTPFGAAAQFYFAETFEGGNIFGPAPGYSLSTLAGAVSAPNTLPALHINQGGDAECVYTEASFSDVKAFAPWSFGDVRIDGYIGIGVGGNVGQIIGGLILRAIGPGDLYVAYIDSNAGNPRGADLAVARMKGGIISQSSFLYRQGIPNFDPLHEDYHLTFEASGSVLNVSLARENIEGGVVVETPLVSASMVDYSLSAGQVGLLSFARNPHAVFFDDITVRAVPEPQTNVLIALGLICSFALPVKRRLFEEQSRSIRRNAQ